MIRLAGLSPGTDVKIDITGVRPGEKLFEEIFHGSEPPVATECEGILLAAPRVSSLDDLAAALDELSDACRDDDIPGIRNLIRTLVPEYHAWEDTGAKAASG